LKGVHPDLLPERERLLDLLLLDALDSEALEGDGHGVGRDLEGADALLAALLAHEVVRVRTVRRVVAHARDDHDGATMVADNLKLNNVFHAFFLL
jgi:hypothetical protein